MRTTCLPAIDRSLVGLCAGDPNNFPSARVIRLLTLACKRIANACLPSLVDVDDYGCYISGIKPDGGPGNPAMAGSPCPRRWNP